MLVSIKILLVSYMMRYWIRVISRWFLWTVRVWVRLSIDRSWRKWRRCLRILKKAIISKLVVRNMRKRVIFISKLILRIKNIHRYRRRLSRWRVCFRRFSFWILGRLIWRSMRLLNCYIRLISVIEETIRYRYWSWIIWHRIHNKIHSKITIPKWI